MRTDTTYSHGTFMLLCFPLITVVLGFLPSPRITTLPNSRIFCCLASFLVLSSLTFISSHLFHLPLIFLVYRITISLFISSSHGWIDFSGYCISVTSVCICVGILYGVYNALIAKGNQYYAMVQPSWVSSSSRLHSYLFLVYSE